MALGVLLGARGRDTSGLQLGPHDKHLHRNQHQRQWRGFTPAGDPRRQRHLRADGINFNIPGSGIQTISPTTELPEITEAVTINGYTQPGAQPNTKAVGSDAVLKIELDGASAVGGHGLIISASNSTVNGLVINRTGEGIRITGSDATVNRSVGNYLGTGAAGTKDLGNGDYGVADGDAPDKTIGARRQRHATSSPPTAVRVSSSTVPLPRATRSWATSLVPTRTEPPLGNFDAGVVVSYGFGDTVGGTKAGARNVISNSDTYGVRIYGDGATGKSFQLQFFSNP